MFLSVALFLVRVEHSLNGPIELPRYKCLPASPLGGNMVVVVRVVLTNEMMNVIMK